MNSTSAPLTNRLILAVLSLILLCLVLLVVRAYRAPDPTHAPAPVADLPTPRQEPDSPRGPKPIVFIPRHPASEPSTSATKPSPPPLNNELSASESSSPVVVSAFPPPLYTPGGASPNAGRLSGRSGSEGLRGRAELLGTVRYLGTPPPESVIPLGPACGRLNTNIVTTRHFVVGGNEALANVLVFVSEGHSDNRSIVRPRVRLDQIGCQFQPYVFAVQVKEKFDVRNSDPEMHNIHLTPKQNAERNFGQPVQGQVNTLSLDKPELFVRIKCDVHPWMFTYVSAIEHTAFDVTDTNGVFLLPESLRPGKYTVTAVHQKAGNQSMQVTLLPNESKPLSFHFLAPGFEPVPNTAQRR